VEGGRGKENMDLYIHSPIRLHGAVLSELCTGTYLPFTTSAYKESLIERIHIQQ
jgi:hypothetical protein